MSREVKKRVENRSCFCEKVNCEKKFEQTTLFIIFDP